MVRFSYFLAFLFLSVFIFDASAANVNISYLNPTYHNDWGFIEITQYTLVMTNYNPGLSVFNTEMNDVSINYIYDFDVTDPLIKKDIESIKRINDDYHNLNSQRRIIIDKAYQLTTLSMGATILGLASLTVSFPVSAGFILTELGALGYLLFDLIDDTFDYYADYVELIRKASNTYNSLLYKVERNNLELIEMGISNPNYRGTSVNDYYQTIYLVNSIDSRELSNRENLMKNDLKDKLLYFDYQKLLFNLNLQYSSLVNSHNSAYSKLINTYILQEKIKKNLIEENTLLNSESENLRKKTFDKLKHSTKEFYEIDSYYIIKFSLTSTEFAVPPREHINLASNYYEEAVYEIETAKRILNIKNDNYLIESTIHFDNAINLLVKSDMELSFAEIKSEKIHSSAFNKVVQKYEATLLEYDSFIPNTDMEVENKKIAKKYLDDSKKLIDSKGTTSEKIFNYVLADSKIDSAKSHLNPSNIFYDNVREDATKSLNYLEKVIALAKKDNVDVSNEEDFLNMGRILIKNPSTEINEILDISEKVILFSNNIYDKGKNQYLHLDFQFNEMKDLILILNTYEPTLKFTEYEELISYYGNDGFDKYSSLGNYKTISSELNSLNNKLNLNKKNIIESMLAFNSLISSNHYSIIELDVPSKLVITFSTYFNDNSFDYDGPVKFDVPFNYDPYSSNEIIKPNYISFVYRNKKLSILINNFSPAEVYSFTLNYDKVFAKTLNVKYSSFPISSSSVQINVEREIENISLNQLKINKISQWDSADVFLNGEYYGRIMEPTYTINKYLNSGKNKITESYLFENPLIYSINEISSSGESKKIKVSVQNKIPFEMKKQPLVVDLPFLTPISHSFSENTCAIDRSGFRLTSNTQGSKVYFVSDYIVNGQCSFIVDITGEYDKEKIKNEIDSLLNETDNSRAKDLLDRAKGQVDSEKISDALTNIERAKDLIDQDNLENKQNLLLETEYNKTRDELGKLISELSNIENKRVSDIVARAERNFNEAETLTDYNRKMLKLVAAQSEIDKLRGIGIDLKLKLLGRYNNVIGSWMELVDLGFVEKIPNEVQNDLILLNSLDFTIVSYKEFEILFDLERDILTYEEDVLNLNNEKKNWENDLSISYRQLNDILSNLIKSVERACGNDCPSEMILIAKTNLNLKPNSAYAFSIANKKMRESITQLEGYLENEKSMALIAFEDAKNFVSKINNEDLRKSYLRKLNDIQSKINSGNYVAARRESFFLMNVMHDEDISLMENNDFLLIAAGIGAIILAFILIKIKGQGNGVIETKEEYKSLRKNSDLNKENDEINDEDL